jgi:cysteine desulfurase
MRVYLDHNAGAPLRREVQAAVERALALAGNPSSAHREGARVRRCIEDARAQVAALLGARPADVVFTSGATEANNLALHGALSAGDLLVTTAVEHASVLGPAEAFEAAGGRVRRLPVGGDASLDWAHAAAACAERPRLVSLALANGEVGAVYDVARMAGLAHEVGALVHTDAAQAAGRLALDVAALGVDLLSLSGHKIGAPAGCGALWIRPGVSIRATVHGGPQERERRAGTENLLGIVGLGAAAAVAAREIDAAATRMRRLRDLLWALLRHALPDVERNGPSGEPALPNTLNVTVPDVPGESLLVLLDLGGVAASLGSACAAGSAEPSHVLLAMGASRDRARSGLRTSLGPETTEDDIRRAAAVIVDAVRQIRRGAAA